MNGSSTLILSRHKRGFAVPTSCKGEVMCRRLSRVWILFVCVIVLMGCQEKTKESGLELVDEKRVEIEEHNSKESSEREEQEKSEDESYQYVHVCGQVKEPGVYKLPQNSRIFEAVEAAGGITKDADESALNLAEALQDGQQVYIPSKKEQETQKESGTQVSDGKVDINHASKEELMTLHGIGEARAEAILQYRQEHGDFKSIEELMNVSGIKEGMFQKIKDYIRIG